MEEIKDRVAQLRHRKGWTQKELAEAAGVKQQNIQQVESGNVRAPRFLLALAEALDVSAHWLMSGKGSPEKPVQPEPQSKIRYQMAQRNGKILSPVEKDMLKEEYPNRYETIIQQRQMENILEADRPLRLLAYRIHKLDERVQPDVISMISKYLSDPEANGAYLELIESILSHAEDDLFSTKASDKG